MKHTLSIAALCLALPLAAFAAESGADKDGERQGGRTDKPATEARQGAKAEAGAASRSTDARSKGQRLEQVSHGQQQRGADMGRCRQQATDQHLAGVEWRQAVGACMRSAAP